MKCPQYFLPADILLPDFSVCDGRKWATVACDQFTSEPEYWEKVAAYVGDAPSTLKMMIPEAYLSETQARLPVVHATMEHYLETVLKTYQNAMLYVERTQSDGKIRRGIVGLVDLENYDYCKGASSLIRATEGTVLERIPPRVAIRRGAALEMPHIMLLIDDAEKSVIEPLIEAKRASNRAYDFDLMMGGGHIAGTFLIDREIRQVNEALAQLATCEHMRQCYGAEKAAPLLFAVGDGNHSLASAKAAYEELKKQWGKEQAEHSPARYALAEIVNLHDSALAFEPIYRVVCGVKAEQLADALQTYAEALTGTAAPQKVKMLYNGCEKTIVFPKPEQQLTVGTLQVFLDEYGKANPGCTIDYIHGEDSLRHLSEKEGAVGFLFDGIKKEELFRTVIFDGALPRKAFSMGHAQDKRYYLESRKIK